MNLFFLGGKHHLFSFSWADQWEPTMLERSVENLGSSGIRKSFLRWAPQDGASPHFVFVIFANLHTVFRSCCWLLYPWFTADVAKEIPLSRHTLCGELGRVPSRFQCDHRGDVVLCEDPTVPFRNKNVCYAYRSDVWLLRIWILLNLQQWNKWDYPFNQTFSNDCRPSC